MKLQTKGWEQRRQTDRQTDILKSEFGRNKMTKRNKETQRSYEVLLHIIFTDELYPSSQIGHVSIFFVIF